MAAFPCLGEKAACLWKFHRWMKEQQLQGNEGEEEEKGLSVSSNISWCSTSVLSLPKQEPGNRGGFREHLGRRKTTNWRLAFPIRQKIKHLQPFNATQTDVHACGVHVNKCMCARIYMHTSVCLCE